MAFKHHSRISAYRTEPDIAISKSSRVVRWLVLVSLCLSVISHLQVTQKPDHQQKWRRNRDKYDLAPSSFDRFWPSLCGNSYFRYPCLKNFFFKSSITNDADSAKANTTPLSSGLEQRNLLQLSPAVDPSHVDLTTDDQPKQQQFGCLSTR